MTQFGVKIDNGILKIFFRNRRKDFSPEKIGGAAIVSDAEVAAVDGEVDAVDALQVDVESRKVGEDVHGGQVHHLDGVVRQLKS
jgi:hypothetical protein